MTETNHFDNVAREWDKNIVHTKRTEAITEHFLNMVPINNKMKAMEFGAGTGLLSIALKDYFAEITLMDSSAEMINTSIDKLNTLGLSHLKPILFDIEKQAYTVKKFDVIFSQMALHHAEDIQKLFSTFYDLLLPNGILAIADLYKEDGSFHDFDFNGHFGFEPESLGEMLTTLGFKNFRFQQCFIIDKVQQDGSMKSYPVFLLVAEKA